MPPKEHGPADDPQEWLRQAASDLALARADVPGVDNLEPYCFHAQQAAEKAIKAVLLSQGIRFPFVHDLGRLITLAEDHGVVVPADVREADALTDYAVLTRYPFIGEPVDEEQREEAIRIAGRVVNWARHLVDTGRAS